ncbi:MAG TPA: type II toxin-antitoxin system HicA family toxin [Longimicrobium sp.]
MKVPRDLDARKLVNALKARLGYELTRQEGSHMRLTTQQNGRHSVTIPAHNPVKVGTLARILDQVAGHFNISRGELLTLLFD